MQRSFHKERKERKNVAFFWEERKRTQERCVLLKRTFAQPWQIYPYDFIFRICWNGDHRKYIHMILFSGSAEMVIIANLSIWFYF